MELYALRACKTENRSEPDDSIAGKKRKKGLFISFRLYSTPGQVLQRKIRCT
jgi:hypothetical protein